MMTNGTSSPRGPQTTVVVPVWDDYVSERLQDALASIRSQDLPARLVVVDNASEIPLPPLPGAWVLRAPRRLSLGAARNLGLQRVGTPYVVFWDADDVMLEGTLAFLEAAIEADPNLVAYSMAVIEDPSRERHRWPRRWLGRLVAAPRALAVLNSIWSLYPTTGATIMHTEAVRAVGGFSNADSGDDWCLGVSLLYQGRAGWSERPGRLYRANASSNRARLMTPANLTRHAASVRERIEADPAVPRWAKRSLPAIYLAQHAAIGAHMALERARPLAEEERYRRARAAIGSASLALARARETIAKRRG